MAVYIQSAAQITIQSPLCDDWFTSPIRREGRYFRSVEPDFKAFIDPMASRRMGRLLKRAIASAMTALEGYEAPLDAIVTGTGLGCIETTEKFLNAMLRDGEQALPPSFFMQSTHNTVGSALAIYTKTHGYNTTYSHSGTSFDLTLLDAWMQMQLGKISTALVGGHDEMTEQYFSLLQKVGYLGVDGMVPCGEVAMSMMLNTSETVDHLCELAGLRISFRPSREKLQQQLDDMLADADMTLLDISAVMTGVNGDPENDQLYHNTVEALFAGKPLLHYKHLFGENYTVSGLGLYACAHLLKKNKIPSFLYESEQRVDALKSILMLNQTKEGDVSMILLKKA